MPQGCSSTINSTRENDGQQTNSSIPSHAPDMPLRLPATDPVKAFHCSVPTPQRLSDILSHWILSSEKDKSPASNCFFLNTGLGFILTGDFRRDLS